MEWSVPWPWEWVSEVGVMGKGWGGGIRTQPSTAIRIFWFGAVGKVWSWAEVGGAGAQI